MKIQIIFILCLAIFPGKTLGFNTPEFTEDSVFSEDLSEIDNFYLNYTYRGWVTLNDSVEFDRRAISDLIAEQESSGGLLSDILALNFEFTRMEDLYYQVDFLFRVANYTFEGRLYFDFENYQYSTIEHLTGTMNYLPLIIPNDNRPVPLGTTFNGIIYSSPNFLDYPEISDLKYYYVYAEEDPYYTLKKEEQDSYLAYYEIHYVSLTGDGGGVFEVSMKYNIRLYGGSLHSIDHLLKQACPMLDYQFEASLRLDLLETDLNLLYSIDPVQYDYGTEDANSDGGTGIPGYELLVAMTGVIVIMMVKNTKKKSTVSPIVP